MITTILGAILLFIPVLITVVGMAMHDEYPQWMNLTRVTMNGTTYAESETQTPNTVAGAWVMEIFQIQFEFSPAIMTSAGAVSADQIFQYIAAISTRSQGSTMPNLNNSQSLQRCQLIQETQYAEAGETGGAGMAMELTKTFSYKGKDGRGFLVAAEALFLGALGSDGDMNNDVDARILYSATKVSAVELAQLLRQ